MENDVESELAGTHRMFARSGSTQQTENNVTLIPQPTDSPNDPLNWSLFRKYWHSALVLFIVGLTAATSNSAGATFDGESGDLGISDSALNIAAGVLFIGIGYCTLLLGPAPFLYGRRSSYLICIVFSMIGCLWWARVRTTQDSIWNQLFVGASESCAEATAQLSLSDLFFQHQRGTILGLYILAVSIGTFLGPLISGYIADSALGWRWVPWFALIISGVSFVVFWFGFEETFFDRKTVIEGIGPSAAGSIVDSPHPEKQDVKDPVMPAVANSGGFEDGREKPRSYRQRIAPITRAPTLMGTGFKQYIKRLFLICRVFTFPAVLYAGIQWGFQDAWLTFYLTVEETNWYDPPWNYSDAADGVMNLPTLIGAIIGCVYGGWFSDVFVLWMAKRNNGITEAEHRLWLLFPVALINPVGLILFGIGTDKGWTWPVPYVGLAFIGFGWGCAGDLSMAYLMDAYPEMVLEGMVGVAVVNNTIAMIFTFTCQPWLDAHSVTEVFVAIGIICFVTIMLTIPMMCYGKTCRRLTKKRYDNFVKLRDEQ